MHQYIMALGAAIIGMWIGAIVAVVKNSDMLYAALTGGAIGFGVIFCFIIGQLKFSKG